VVNEALIDSTFEELIKRRETGAREQRDIDARARIEFDEDGDRVLLLPRTCFVEDNPIRFAHSAMVETADFATLTAKLESDFELIDSEEVDRFFTGFAFGLSDNRPTRLDRSKQGIERGRAFAYALRLHGEFQSNKMLGLTSLKKDNFFFGNSINEKNASKQPVRYAIKTVFTSFFKDI